MHKILLINPKSRKSKGRRVAVPKAQKRKRKAKTLHAKANPATKVKGAAMAKKTRRRRKLHGAAKSAFLARMRKGRRGVIHARKNPSSRRRRRRASHVIRVRRNPIFSGVRRRARSAGGRGVQLTQAGIRRVAMPAAIAGIGALGLDVLMGVVGKYLPEQMRTGPLNSVAKIVGALGLGALVSKFGSKQMGEAVAIGGVTVTVHDVARAWVQKAAPAVPLAGMEADSLGLYDMEALSAYGPGLGFYNPAPLTNDSRSMGLYTDNAVNGWGG